MSKYVTGLLAVAVAAGCSDKRPETAARARPAATPAAPPTAADTVPGSGGILPRAVPLAQVPAALRQPGQLLEAWRWPDANGENLLVVFRRETATPPPPAAAASAPAPYAFNELTTGAGPAYTAQLSARQYVRRQGAYTELWRLRDFVTNCPLRLTLRPLPGSTAITDLDHDGRSETTLVYALACRSGPASAGLKLIMRAGQAKYALRGATVRPQAPAAAGPGPPTDPCCLNELSPAQRRLGEPGGYYQTEAGFRGAPPAFLRFARQHWQKSSFENNQGG